ncbi:hypothetical protein ACLOJK_028300, partial [Asimina triloba]
ASYKAAFGFFNARQSRFEQLKLNGSSRDVIQQKGATTNSKGEPIGKSKHQSHDYNCNGTH